MICDSSNGLFHGKKKKKKKKKRHHNFILSKPDPYVSFKLQRAIAAPVAMVANYFNANHQPAEESVPLQYPRHVCLVEFAHIELVVSGVPQ
jgi:hypothetical protein